MTFKQFFYSSLMALIVVAVTLFALKNFQDVEVVIPFLGTFHTKVFVVVVFSFLAGFITSGLLSIILKIFSLPSNLKKRKKSEIGSVPESIKNSKEKNSS